MILMKVKISEFTLSNNAKILKRILKLKHISENENIHKYLASIFRLKLNPKCSSLNPKILVLRPTFSRYGFRNSCFQNPSESFVTFDSLI